MLLITLNAAQQVCSSFLSYICIMSFVDSSEILLFCLVDIVGGLFYCLILHNFFWQSHSLQCTESFMRENVVEELQQMQPDDETKQKMLDILKRFHSEEETDSMDVDGMLLYFCLLWECWLLLTVGENITRN